MQWSNLVTLDHLESMKFCPFVGCPEENSGNSDSGKAAPTAESSAEWSTSVTAEVKAQETATTEADAKPKTDLLNQQTGADPSRITRTSVYLAGCFWGPGNSNSCLCENVYFMLSEMYDTQL